MALTESEGLDSKSYTKSGIFNVFLRYQPHQREKSEHIKKKKKLSVVKFQFAFDGSCYIAALKAGLLGITPLEKMGRLVGDR